MFRHLFHVALLTLLLGAGALAEENIGELLLQADEAVKAGQSKQAVDLLTKAIAIRPNLASAYYTRGRERFRLGQLEKSVADFDRHVALAPDQESRQWERGIAYYYVGKFKQGAAQFELYQTYHDNDVENSVWRYLCMVPTTGIEKARSVMLPIKDDRRNPMMQVFNLYRGRLKRDGTPLPPTCWLVGNFTRTSTWGSITKSQATRRMRASTSIWRLHRH